MSWFNRAVIYQIFIDRFSGVTRNDWQKSEYMGGTLRGITEKVDYLADLRIDAIWITPFFKGEGYHGYQVTDFNQVDSRFGTIDELKELIDVFHGRGIKVISDFVPNHLSITHPFFQAAQKDKNSEYFNWFYFKNWPDDYLCFVDFKNLPKINLNYKPARDYIVNSAKRWLDLGFDGFRLDHVIGPNHTFWRHFREELLDSYPEVVLFGEAWRKDISIKHYRTFGIKNKFWRMLFGINPVSLIKDYVSTMDGVLDFKALSYFGDFARSEGDDQARSELNERLVNHYACFDPEYPLVLFLDNHDLERYMYRCNNRIHVVKRALDTLLDQPKPVVIYYGTEIGMSQRGSFNDMNRGGDILAREPMNWNIHYHELRDFIKYKIRERKTKFV